MRMTDRSYNLILLNVWTLF